MEHGTMTSHSTTGSCDGCGKKAAVSEFTTNIFCDNCHLLATTIHDQPELISKICTLTQSEPGRNQYGHGVCPPSPRELPEVLDAVRFRTSDREQNTWYVSISELEGNPVEIFASTAFDRDQHLQSRISNLTTITRLISLILRHIFLGETLNLEKTTKQLHRSSRQRNDLPDMLTRVLSKYLGQEKTTRSDT